MLFSAGLLGRTGTLTVRQKVDRIRASTATADDLRTRTSPSPDPVGRATTRSPHQTAGTIGSEPTTPVTAVQTTRFRVYNDLLPRVGQPETPENLPEARHQSQLQGSYTVPARLSSPFPVQTPTARRLRRRGRRSPSPPGLRTPGFLGLYGGIENTDDATLFVEAARPQEPNEEHIFR